MEKKSPRTTVENLQKSKQQRKELEKVGAENLEEYERCLNMVASTEAGAFFLKSLIKSLGVFKPINTKGSVDDIVTRNVYLEKIRPFLDNEIRKELEE